MAQLRRTIISSIFKTLETSTFTLEDFDVELEDSNSFVFITFLPFPEYTFQITEKDISVRSVTNILERQRADMKLFTIESPGEYKTKASRQSSSIHDCISRIPEWCENIEAELSAPIPEADITDEFEEELKERINSTAGDSFERFNDGEITTLKEKLELLNSKFETLQKENKLTEKELADLKTQVDKMKGNLSTYPKSTWYKVSGNKILDMMKNVIKTKEGRELLVSSIKNLIEKL